MNKFFLKFLLINLTFILVNFVECWDRQNNLIEPPEIPYYQLKGKVIDLDNSLPLSNVQITLKALELQQVETTNYPEKYSTTDENGNFTFDSLYIGVYQLSFVREGFIILEKGYFQNYGDSSLIILLPTPLSLENSKNFIILNNFSIFKNRVIRSLSISQTNDTSLVLLSNEIFPFRLVSFNKNFSHWTILATLPNPLPENRVGTLNNITLNSQKSRSFCGTFSLSSNIYFFQIDSNQFIHSIDTLKFSKEPWDIFAYNQSIYISSSNSIWDFDIFSLSLNQILNLPRENYYITDFVYYPPYFWIYDINHHYLTQCDKNLNILKTYIPFYQKSIAYIEEMAIDNQGKIYLWLREQKKS